MKQQINKKHKKSYNNSEFDIDMLKDELIKPKQFSKKPFKSDKRKRR